jgi:murein DD-endopeptidase MepM/ murein hydrolase activator NlpD
LKKKIQRIETKLNQNNNKYILTVKKRQAIDLEIYEIERALHNSIEQLESKQAKLDREYKLLLLNSLDEATTEDLMTKRIVLNRIKKDRIEVNAQLTNERGQKTRLNLLRNQFAEIVKVERELYDLVQRLESNKQDYVKSYMEESENAVKLRSKLKKAVRKKVAKTKKRRKKRSKKAIVANTYIKKDFIHAIDDYVSIDHDKKGIYYHVKNVTDVKVSKAGKVMHVGTLANYGNVVMVEHADNLKSIFLGSFIAQVKKGDQVSPGSVIGETRKHVNQNALGKVYFEVRQKNNVQDTIKLVKSNQTQA